VDDRRAVAVLFLILKQQAKKRGGNQNKQRKRAASRSVFDGHEEKKAIWRKTVKTQSVREIAKEKRKETDTFCGFHLSNKQRRAKGGQNKAKKNC
jgi:hypothetical protein